MHPRRITAASDAAAQKSSANVSYHAPWPEKLSSALHPLLDLPPLQSLPPEAIQQVDVVIVGGGVTGLSAAHAAATAGARVLLLDAGSRLGLGASGRNAGIVSVGANLGLSDVAPGDPIAALWPATTEVANQLFQAAQQPGALLDARQTGALSLAREREETEWMACEAEARMAAGLRAEVWTAAQVVEKTAGRLNTDGVEAALWLPDEGRVYPLTLLAHLAGQARAAGAMLAGSAEVVAYEEVGTPTQSGKAPFWHLTLRDGLTIQTPGLIWAIGPTIAPTARLYALAFVADLPDDFPAFWDAAHYVYYDYRPGNDWLIVSGGPYGVVGAVADDPAFHQQMAGAAQRWLPELAQRSPVYTWAVDLAVTADMLPMLRSLGKRAPGHAIEGLGAQGVLPGIVLGRQAGELVARQVM